MFNRNCSDISQQRFPAIHYHLGGGGQVAEPLLGPDPRGSPPPPPLVQLLPVWTRDGVLAIPPRGRPAGGAEAGTLLSAPSPGSHLGLPSCCQWCLCVNGGHSCLLSHCPQKGEDASVSGCGGAGAGSTGGVLWPLQTLPSPLLPSC